MPMRLTRHRGRRHLQAPWTRKSRGSRSPRRSKPKSPPKRSAAKAPPRRAPPRPPRRPPPRPPPRRPRERPPGSPRRRRPRRKASGSRAKAPAPQAAVAAAARRGARPRRLLRRPDPRRGGGTPGAAPHDRGRRARGPHEPPRAGRGAGAPRRRGARRPSLELRRRRLRRASPGPAHPLLLLGPRPGHGGAGLRVARPAAGPDPRLRAPGRRRLGAGAHRRVRPRVARLLRPRPRARAHLPGRDPRRVARRTGAGRRRPVERGRAAVVRALAGGGRPVRTHPLGPAARQLAAGRSRRGRLPRGAAVAAGPPLGWVPPDQRRPGRSAPRTSVRPPPPGPGAGRGRRGGKKGRGA